MRIGGWNRGFKNRRGPTTSVEFSALRLKSDYIQWQLENQTKLCLDFSVARIRRAATYGSESPGTG
jgi:hypothetical protein